VNIVEEERRACAKVIWIIGYLRKSEAGGKAG